MKMGKLWHHRRFLRIMLPSSVMPKAAQQHSKRIRPLHLYGILKMSATQQQASTAFGLLPEIQKSHDIGAVCVKGQALVANVAS